MLVLRRAFLNLMIRLTAQFLKVLVMSSLTKAVLIRRFLRMIEIGMDAI